ncbi:MAG: ABC transporter permease [Fuscovulum sp.]|nr:ABC transporter permease [Fuscovulum sp.]
MTSDTAPRRKTSLSALIERLGPWRLVVGMVLILLAFATVEPRVISVANLRNIAIQASYLSVFALAQCLVILTRGFDLSLGFAVSLVSVLSAMAMVASGSAALGIAAGLGVGLVIGLANGALIGGIGLNPLVTTLGMANIVMALASTLSGGFPVSGLPAGFTHAFSQATVLGLPSQLWIVAVLFLLGWVLLRATRLGRSLYIIGANPRAAVAAGINTFGVLVSVYTISSVLTAIGALLLTARTGSGEPNLGGNLTLEAIAAAVVGGARLSGGQGGVASALLGALFVTVLSNGMNLIRLDGYLQQICLGAIIVVSLILSRENLRR